MWKRISLLLTVLLVAALGVWGVGIYTHTREMKRELQKLTQQTQSAAVSPPSEPVAAPISHPEPPPKKPLLAESVLGMEPIPSTQTMKTNGAKYAADILEKRAIRQAELKQSPAENPLFSATVAPNVKLNLGYRLKDMSKDFYEFGRGQVVREGYAGFGISF